MVAAVSRWPPLAWIVLAAALLALAAGLLLPPSLRLPVALALALLAAAVTTYATLSPGAGLLVRAWTRAPHGRPEVALTFDDGPDPAATPALLDLLAERGAKATFFVVGERARAHPELVRRIVREGHLVGNHSDRHAAWTNLLGTGALRRELTRCQETLAELTGAAPRYYRPPMGLVSHAVAPACAALGLEVVAWHVRGLDTTGRSVERVVARVLAGVAPGAIVCLHDGGQDPDRVRAITAAALDGLAVRGLRPVRLDELLA